jgi:VWFA-related protein
VFRAGTDLVTIDASVRLRNAPITGLTARDFELLDNGVAQAIELQSTDTVPVDVTVLFGQYQTRDMPGQRLASDLAKIAEWLRPIDRLRVITFAGDVREVFPMEGPRTSERKELPNVAPSQFRAKLLLAQGDLNSRQDPRLRGESLFDALLLALARPAELGRRHLVVVFSWNSGTGSVLADGNFLQTVASRTDALLHIAFSWGRTEGIAADSVPGQYARLALADAAAATGGAIHNASNGVGAFKSIFEDFRQSYLLRYTATGAPPGGWHMVVVKTPGFPAYEVRARKGYMGR